MLFLTSNGLTSPALQDEFRNAIASVGKRCAIIPTAMEKEKDKDAWLEENTREAWGDAIITKPVSIETIHRWRKENPDAFIAAIAE